MQKYLWKGDHYLIYNDTEKGKVLDAVFRPAERPVFRAFRRRAGGLSQGECRQGLGRPAGQGLQTEQARNAADLFHARRLPLD